MEVLQGRLPYEIFTQSFLHLAWPETCGPKSGSRSALIVGAHAFSWPPVHLRYVRSGVGRSRSLISSPSRRLASRTNSVTILEMRRWRRSSTKARHLCTTCIEIDGCCHCQRPSAARTDQRSPALYVISCCDQRQNRRRENAERAR